MGLVCAAHSSAACSKCLYQGSKLSRIEKACRLARLSQPAKVNFAWGVRLKREPSAAKRA